MKKIKQTIATLLSTLSWAAGANPFYNNKDWKAETAEQHVFWQQPVCMVSTIGSDKITRLEVIAIASEDGYLDQIVQIIGPMTDVFLEIMAASQRDRAFDLLPLYKDNPNGVIAAVAQLKDYEILTNEIAAKSQITAKYYDAQGIVKTVSFSLRGSSAALVNLFEKCDLGFSSDTETLD